MKKLEICDELKQIEKTIGCFSDIFLLISNQSEPLENRYLAVLSRFLSHEVERIQRIEEEIHAFEEVKESSA